MRFVGVDLHKRVVVVCVVELQGGKRVVVARGRWTCQDTAGLTARLARFLRSAVRLARCEKCAEPMHQRT